MLVIKGQGVLVELGDKELILLLVVKGQGVLAELGDKELNLCWC